MFWAMRKDQLNHWIVVLWFFPMFHGIGVEKNPVGMMEAVGL